MADRMSVDQPQPLPCVPLRAAGGGASHLRWRSAKAYRVPGDRSRTIVRGPCAVRDANGRQPDGASARET